MKRFAARLLPVLLLFTSAALATSSRQEEADGAAKAMVNHFVESWNLGDGGAYGENYWPDAELVDPSGIVLTGRAAIVKEHVDLWAGIFKGTRQKATIRRVKVLSPEYIVVDFDAHLSGVHAVPPGAAPPAGGVLVAHLKHILQKRQGVWRVLFAQNTLVATPEPAK